MRIDIITLFPGMFDGMLKESILKRALDKELCSYHVHNLRDYTVYSHNQVDDRPFGGGPGMLIMPDPVFRAVESIEDESEIPSRRIMLAPAGETYSQRKASELSGEKRLMLLCGRYEGFDQRIADSLGFEEISIGDYVISGGELASLVIIESVIRLIPGVLGNEESVQADSFADEENEIIEYPQYTRPAEYRGMKVPEILLSGDHAKVAQWRSSHSRRKSK